MTIRNIFKNMVRTFARLFIIPYLFHYAITRIAFGNSYAFQNITQCASRWAGAWGVILRESLLRQILSKTGKNVHIGYGSIITKPSIEFGDHVYVGLYCVLGDVSIGDHTLIADQVIIPSGNAQHGISSLDIPISQQSGTFTKIIIGKDCWIGSSSTILANIGDHCVVGAGSVVTKPVEDFLIVAGNPAKVIGDRRIGP